MPQKPVGAPCNESIYFGLDCDSYFCENNVCTALPTSPAPTVTYVYEGNFCYLNNGYCHPSLSCINDICQKWFSSNAICLTGLNCAPGYVCIAGCCVQQTSSTLIGGACTANTDCNSQIGDAQCFCNAPGSSSGVCMVPDVFNGYTFSQTAVTNCQALVNQYLNEGSITSSNAATALTNFECVLTCVSLNGMSSVFGEWAGNNFVEPNLGSISNCVYTPPTPCSNPTTSPNNLLTKKQTKTLPVATTSAPTETPTITTTASQKKAKTKK